MTINKSKHSIILRFIQLALFGIILCFSPLNTSFAEDTTEVDIDQHTKLNDIEESLKEINTKQAELKKKLTQKPSEEEIEEINQSIVQLNKQKKDYQILFEQISLGGIDTSQFIDPPEEKKDQESYNWQQEVVQILQPVFAELRRMTETARKRDQLREERKVFDTRIALAKEGVKNIEGLSKERLSPESLKNVEILHKEWQDKLESLKHDQKIVALKLQDLTDNTSFIEKLNNNAWGFIKGRGLIIATAIGAGLALYYIFAGILKFLVRISERKKYRTTNFKFRLFLLVGQLVTFTIALFTSLMILHSSGDMVLFGFAILILIALLLSFRNSIPTYIRRLRLFLNLGQIREGERLIYNGIPWKIEQIHLYGADLKNPLLDNGKMRVALEIVEKLISRPVRMDEIWYPSKTGDTLLLPDGKLVEVIRQTPESIYLDNQGSHIIFPTAEFINLKARNISLGYTRSISFSIDKSATETSLFEIGTQIKKGIVSMLTQEITDQFISEKNIDVLFKQIIGGTMIHYTVMITVSSQMERYYFIIPSLIQSAIIQVAEKNNWKLMTIDAAI